MMENARRKRIKDGRKIYAGVHEEEVSGEHIQEEEEGLELRKRRRRNRPKKKIKREAKQRTG